MNNSFSDDLFLYSTVKIESINPEGKTITGTGFYFNFGSQENKLLIGVVTNKHVMKDSMTAQFEVIIAQDGVPMDTAPLCKIIDNLEDKLINHPDPKVDLCLIPLTEIVQESDLAKGQVFFTHWLSKDNFLSEDEINELTAVEDVIMIGYPNGLIDEYNHKPLVRKGITSTSINYDYGGEKEFLIDMPCFEGSSGSPIFWHTYSMFAKEGNHFIGYRTRLIGVLYNGFDSTVEGQLVKIEISKIATRVKIHLNIGVVLKVERLLELGKEFIRSGLK